MTFTDKQLAPLRAAIELLLKGEFDAAATGFRTAGEEVPANTGSATDYNRDDISNSASFREDVRQYGRSCEWFEMITLRLQERYREADSGGLPFDHSRSGWRYQIFNDEVIVPELLVNNVGERLVTLAEGRALDGGKTQNVVQTVFNLTKERVSPSP